MENSYDSSYRSTTGTSVLSVVMRKVYVRMFFALVVTALTALYVASSPAILTTILGSRTIFFGLMIAELAVVFIVTGMLHKLSTTTAVLLFYLMQQNSMIFCAGIAAVGLYFCKPTEAKLLTDLEGVFAEMAPVSGTSAELAAKANCSAQEYEIDGILAKLSANTEKRDNPIRVSRSWSPDKGWIYSIEKK